MNIEKMLTVLGFGDRKDAESIIASIGYGELIKLMEIMLKGLPSINVEVWRLSYGIGKSPKNMDDIAHALGIGITMVYTIKRETKRMLLHASRISVLTKRVRNATMR